MRVQLQRVAHVRSGDKGDTSNITVIAYDAELYEPLKAQLTPERLQQHYKGLITGPVLRYAVDHLWALNFVCHGALGGGVSRSLRLDNYGKSLSSALLGLELELPDGLANHLRGPG
jgi:hypothetical protein